MLVCLGSREVTDPQMRSVSSVELDENEEVERQDADESNEERFDDKSRESSSSWKITLWEDDFFLVDCVCFSGLDDEYDLFGRHEPRLCFLSRDFFTCAFRKCWLVGLYRRKLWNDWRRKDLTV